MTNTLRECKCINSSDKADLDQVVSENIDDFDAKLTMMRRSQAEFEDSGINVGELLTRYEARKSQLKNLLTKIRNTPSCK